MIGYRDKVPVPLSLCPPVPAAFETYVEGTKLKNVDIETQKLYGVRDELGNLKQVKPDFTIYGNNQEIVAIGDAKTTMSGTIPFNNQARNLIRLAAAETTSKKLIYYIPESISPTITDDFFVYAKSKEVRIQFVVVK